MNRRALAVAVAVACAFVAVSGSAAAEPPNAADLEAELVCPVCETTLDQSNAPVAQRMKAFVRARVAAGDTEAEIKDKLVAEFGPGVIANPPKSGFGLLAWLLPLAALLVGAVVVGLLVREWSTRRGSVESEATAQLEPELDRRVDEELARFEG